MFFVTPLKNGVHPEESELKMDTDFHRYDELLLVISQPNTIQQRQRYSDLLGPCIKVLMTLTGALP
jgi:hypothetical protein